MPLSVALPIIDCQSFGFANALKNLDASRQKTVEMKKPKDFSFVPNIYLI